MTNRSPRIRTNFASRGSDSLSVDYATVLSQAVANERFRVLRDVRLAVEAIKTSTAHRDRSWDTTPRSAAEIKTEILAKISDLEFND